jgi:hypothetical protein
MEQIGVDLPPDGPDPFAESEPQPAEPEPQQPEPDEPEQPAEPERPDWLPEQYKKPEDLASAHKSLQNELRLRAEREKQLTEQMGQMAQALREPPQVQTDPIAQAAEALQEARDSGDTYRELQIQQWLQQQTLQQALGQYQQQAQSAYEPAMAQQNEMVAIMADTEMSRRYDDWSEEMQGRVASVIANDPFFSNQQVNSVQDGTNLLERAYQFVKYHELVGQQEQLKQAGLQQADLDRAAKLRAQTISGATGRAEQPSPEDIELAKMQQSLASSYTAMRQRHPVTQ